MTYAATKIVFLLICTLMFCTVSHSSPVTSAMRNEDPRLQKSLSVNGYNLYVGELLEKISRESGVMISSAGRSIDDERVSVGFRGTPVADVMDTLRSVLSYQGETCEWSRTKSAKGEWEYILTARDSHLKKDIDALARRELEEEIGQKIAALNLSPGERKRWEDANPSLAMTDRDAGALRSLANLLTPAQIHSGVFDGKEFVFAPDQSSKTFIDSERNTYNKAANNSPLIAPFSEPEGIKISVKRSQGRISYDLWILLNQGGVESGYAWAGGMPAEKRWRAKLKDLWRTRIDTPITADVADRQMGPPPRGKVETDDVAASDSILYSRLSELSERSGLSFTARIGSSTRKLDPGAMPAGMKVSEFLAKLDSANIDYKMVHGVLAMTNHENLFESGESITTPWRVVKHLRQTCERDPLQQLHWEEFAFAAAHASPEQLRAMHSPEQWTVQSSG